MVPDGLIMSVYIVNEMLRLTSAGRQAGQSARRSSLQYSFVHTPISNGSVILSPRGVHVQFFKV